MTRLISITLFLLFGSAAHATTLGATLSSLGGTLWMAEYAVSNDSLDVNIEQFTIYFDIDLYADLAVVPGGPDDWDSIVVQPDPGIPDSGFFDSLALGDGIAPGDTVGGFQVMFHYLGDGAPPPQAFDVIDPTTFQAIDSGTTAIVPVPGAMLLFSGALGGLAALRRRRLHA